MALYASHIQMHYFRAALLCLTRSRACFRHYKTLFELDFWLVLGGFYIYLKRQIRRSQTRELKTASIRPRQRCCCCCLKSGFDLQAAVGSVKVVWVAGMGACAANQRDLSAAAVDGSLHRVGGAVSQHRCCVGVFPVGVTSKAGGVLGLAIDHVVLRPAV